MRHQQQSNELAITLEPESRADAAVIWLHGLGADGHDFVPVVPELGLPADAAVRFIFPHAPVRPVTINGGMPMRAWFDALGLTRGTGEDAVGIAESTARIDALLDEQRQAGIASERLILAGFSQGGALTLHAGLRHPQRLGGLIALSTWLPLADSLAGEASVANRQTPVLICHGSMDPMVPMNYGAESRDRLIAAGYDVRWHDYPMQHQVCMEEIEVIGAFLREVLDTDTPRIILPPGA